MAGLAEHYQRLAFAHFAGRSVSDARAAALARIGQTSEDGPTDRATEVIADSARVKQGLKGLLNHIVLNGLLVLGACIALASVDIQLGVVLFAGAGAVVALAILGATRVAAVAAEHRRGEARLSGVIRDVVSSGRGEPYIDELSDLRGLDVASASADISMTRCEGRTTCAVHVVLTATAAAVLAVGVGASSRQAQQWQSVHGRRLPSGGLRARRASGSTDHAHRIPSRQRESPRARPARSSVREPWIGLVRLGTTLTS